MPAGIIIALGPKKSNDSSLAPQAKLRATGGRQPAPFGGTESPAEETAEPRMGGGAAPMGQGGKADPTEAQVSTGEQRCGACSNWEREANSCSKVDGTMNFNDGCAKYFEAMGGGSQAGGGMGLETPLEESREPAHLGA